MRHDHRPIVLPILLSVIVAMMLTIIPLPVWAGWFRPTWLVLVMLYWGIYAPDQMCVECVWGLGLLLDVLCGMTLGVQALALVFVYFFANKFHTRIRLFPLGQQVGAIFLLLLCYQCLLFWVQGALNELPPATYWLSLPISTLLWPWVAALLHQYQRHYAER